MSRLLTWMCYLIVYSLSWIFIMRDSLPFQINDSIKEIVFVSPIYLLMTFACYSLASIGYGVVKFNDCEDAAKELKTEMECARKDLIKMGLEL